MKDELYKKNIGSIKDFAFDEKTADVFDDMLVRSVPYYNQIQEMIATYAENYAQENSKVYDLGCSTGTTMNVILERLAELPIELIGIDSSGAMIDKAREKLQKAGFNKNYSFIEKDLNDISLSDASVVISNLTLQFIRPSNRKKLLSAVYSSLRDKGIFILVEKLVSKDPAINRLFIKLYYEFKQKNGYSQTEISQKREALENVLIPYTYEENIKLLKDVGFLKCDEFFRWHNFCGIVAFK